MNMSKDKPYLSTSNTNDRIYDSFDNSKAILRCNIKQNNIGKDLMNQRKSKGPEVCGAVTGRGLQETKRAEEK